MSQFRGPALHHHVGLPACLSGHLEAGLESEWVAGCGFAQPAICYIGQATHDAPVSVRGKLPCSHVLAPFRVPSAQTHRLAHKQLVLRSGSSRRVEQHKQRTRPLSVHIYFVLPRATRPLITSLQTQTLLVHSEHQHQQSHDSAHLKAALFPHVGSGRQGLISTRPIPQACLNPVLLL